MDRPEAEERMTDSPRQPEQTQGVGDKLAWAALLTAALAAILVLLMGYLVVSRMGRVEEGVAGLQEKVETIGSQARVARDEAVAARQAADLAAQGRRDAESAEARAELETRQAIGEADLARADAQKARDEAAEIRRQREEELNQLKDTLSQIVETRRTALGLVMSLGGDSMQFDFNRATLRPENRELLSRIAGILLTLKGFGIYVYGHTDDVGTEAYNLDLSEKRARAVRDYLVEAGIDGSSITTKGFGKSRPLVDATDAISRAKNRRVEIGIVQAALKHSESVGAPK